MPNARADHEGNVIRRKGKQTVYSELLDMRRNSGLSVVSRRYRAIFGVWPRGMRMEPKPASPELKRYVHRLAACRT